MAPVTLPPSFYNSFWSSDYRTGLEVLFKNLEQGCLENEDVLSFIDHQIVAHRTLSSTLLAPPLSTTSPNSTSSLQHSLLSLRGASSARGDAHRALAAELSDRVLAGFRTWKQRHEDKIGGARDEVLGKNGLIAAWEKDIQKLQSLKQAYLTKTRAADESDDDAKFAPASVNSSPDHYTTSPKPKHGPLQRSGTVADRIHEKLRQASVNVSSTPSTTSSSLNAITSSSEKPLPPSVGALRPPTHAPQKILPGDTIMSPADEKFVPPTPSDNLGQPQLLRNRPPVPSKLNPHAPPQDQTPPILLSGLSMSAKKVQDLLKKFEGYLSTVPAPGTDHSNDDHASRTKVVAASRQRGTILGIYEKTFSGEEVVGFLRANVEGFGQDWERCADAAAELHRMGYLSRAGVGRGFEPNADTHYVLKIPTTPKEILPASPSPISPLKVSPPGTTTFSVFKQYLPSALASSDEPAHVRLRKEAIKADEAYKAGVNAAEEKRLDLEERIERGLRVWERWERERLGVVRNVLKQYDEALSRLPGRLSDLQSSTSLSVEAYNPDADLKALIEGNRTGPFRPRPIIYESIESDVPEVNFGIDLRRWSGDQGWKASATQVRPKGSVPEVLSGLLKALNEVYSEITDDERRKSWLYEVPLDETHGMREAINDPLLTVDQIADIVRPGNVPVIAGTVKLWLLELNPPIMGWEGWEDAKAVYPSVGADQERDVASAVASVLGRLPGSQLYVLDALIKHFRDMIDHSKTEESNEVYITKLALSLGRNVLRPQQDNDLTIGDRTPSLFVADLISLYYQIFPSLVEKKKLEADRPMPYRKRTVLVDQRISRSRLSGQQDPQEILEAQRAMQNPKKNQDLPSPPPHPEQHTPAPVPALPNLAQPIRREREEQPLIDAYPTQHQSSHTPSERASYTPPAATAVPSPPPPIQTQPPAAAPSFVDPNDSDDDDDDGIFRPPQNQTQTQAPAPALHDDELISPTAQYIAATEAEATTGSGPEDMPVAGAGAGLRRNQSGETGRLRGPRGARGPRPVPGGAKVPSYATPPES